VDSVPPPLLVAGASSLWTPDGSPSGLGLRDRPAIAIAGGRIAWLGPEGGLPPNLATDPRLVRLDAAGGTLVPGFVDAHTHAVFAGWRADEHRRRLEGASYASIAAEGGGILATVRATRAASREELAELLRSRLDTMLLNGVTTVEVKSGYGLDLGTELRQLEAIRDAALAHPVRVVATYLGAHALPAERAHDREGYLREVMDLAIPRVAQDRLATCCDVFCERGAFSVDESRRILSRARECGLLLKVHADELSASGGAELAAELRALSAEHLLDASDEGLEAMASAGVVAVILPATSLMLRARPVEMARLRRAGCRVAFATDFNPGSSPVDNLPLVAALACITNGATPEEALTGITLHAAAALGLEDEIGALMPGRCGDVVVLDAPDASHLAYRMGARLARHVVRAGQVVVRDFARVA